MPQVWVRLLDDLIGANEDGLWHGQAKLLGCLEIDHKLESSRPLDRKIGRFRTFQDARHIARRLALALAAVAIVGDQRAGHGKGRAARHERQMRGDRQVSDPLLMNRR